MANELNHETVSILISEADWQEGTEVYLSLCSQADNSAEKRRNARAVL